MQLPDTKALPDESLAMEILTPLLLLSGLLAAMLFGLLLIWQWQKDIWAYLLVGTLALSVGAAHRALVCRNIQQAGLILAYNFSLLPILSILSFGFEQNVLVFLAPLGVLIAALLVSAYETWRVTLAALVLLIVQLFWVRADLELALRLAGTMAVLLLGIALLSWLVTYTIQATIIWALETADKSRRREDLLRTTQAKLEEAIRERDRLNDELYIANQSLDAARTSAETAYRTKAGFMATMSHELRTPLNLIIGFSTAMLEHSEMYDYQPLAQAYYTDITEIRRSGEHLLRLINDILDFAKIEAGHLKLNKTPMLLEPLLTQVLKTAGGLLKDKPVRLSRDIRGSLPVILADEVRVRQILLNLISNACKFTVSGEIIIGACAQEQELLLWVSDTGVGIASHDQARIFIEFEQGDNHPARKNRGSGLGLSICRWLVELHGGRLWLTSAQGKGSCFYFSLPRISVDDSKVRTISVNEPLDANITT